MLTSHARDEMQLEHPQPIRTVCLGFVGVRVIEEAVGIVCAAVER